VPVNTSRQGQRASVDVRVFARSFALRARNTAWLLGAGASAEAGVPTAGQLIDQLLIELYSSENGIRGEEVLNRPHWKNSVYPLYDGQGGLPTIASDEFYSRIFERVYPDRDSRARFALKVLSGKQPHYGQHILAGLVLSDSAPLLVTTNFDTLIEDSIREMLAYIGDPKRLTVFDPQNSARAGFAMATDQRPSLVKIHGDLGSVTLSNTELELMQHDPALRAMVLAQFNRYGLIIAGYSGRDHLVMRMLQDALQQPKPYPAGLAWVRRPEDNLPDRVKQFLEAAALAGVEPVQEVVVGGFGELMGELERACDLTEPVRRRLSDIRPVPIRLPAARPSGATRDYPQIRFGAIELIQLPDVARRLEVPRSVNLPEMRKALRTSGVRATLGWAGGEFAAFGHDRSLNEALTPLGVTVTSEELRIRLRRNGVIDSGAVGMVSDALTQAIANSCGLRAVLRSNRRPVLRVLFPKNKNADRPSQPASAVRTLEGSLGFKVVGEIMSVTGLRLPWAEAIEIGLEAVEDGWLMLFAPEVWVSKRFSSDSENSGTEEEAIELGKEFVRERLAQRYNKQTGVIMAGWTKLILANSAEIHSFGPPRSEGIDANFTLGGKPISSKRLAGGPIQTN
jgi:hypothetical protein